MSICIKIFSLLLTVLIISSCAHFDTSGPDWNAFEARSQKPSINLFVQSTGTGPPIVLLHGFAAHSYSWRHLQPQLTADHTVFMLDLKGFGLSPKPDDDAYSIYDQARLVVDFIRDRQLYDSSIIGHSFGGGVALAAALYLSKHHPEYISRLVLIDSIAFKQETPLFINILATPVLGELLTYTLPARFQVNNVLSKAYYNDALITEDNIQAYSEPLSREGAKNALITTARQIFPSDLDRLGQQYQNITVPTMIVWGGNDEITPLVIAKKLHQTMPNSSLKIINECGHNPHEECPEQTIPLIVNFLRTR